jgi:putative tryptophan/tyrosine transport system substrate-binding protein
MVRAALALCLLAAPLAAQAQTAGKIYRVGYLSSAADVFEPFREALRELGYVEGRNLVLEVRLASGRLEQLPALAAELVQARVDLIAAVSPPAIRAAKQATATIPIIMAFSGDDPVRSKFVESLARPGGNVTGVMMIADEISGKRLALLHEMLGRAPRIALLAQMKHPASASQVKAAQDAALKLGVELDVLDVRDARDYDAALTSLGKRAPGLFIISNPTFFNDRRQLAAIASRHRVPILCEWREMAEAGCLMAYGPNISDLYRRAATYIDRIARGAAPAELPVERPTKFELTINLKTAKTIGVTVPPSLLLQADQIIR